MDYVDFVMNGKEEAQLKVIFHCTIIWRYVLNFCSMIQLSDWMGPSRRNATARNCLRQIRQIENSNATGWHLQGPTKYDWKAKTFEALKRSKFEEAIYELDFRGIQKGPSAQSY